MIRRPRNHADAYFVQGHVSNVPAEKEMYDAFENVPVKIGLRELKCAMIGSLVSRHNQQTSDSNSSGALELITGSFKCSDGDGFIGNVEQQFKYIQPTICSNPQCQNRRSFILEIDQSKFLDCQKV